MRTHLRKILIALFFVPSASLASECQFSLGAVNLWHYPFHAEERGENMRQQIAVDRPDIMAFSEAASYINGFDLYGEFLSLTGYQGVHAVTNNWGFMHDGVALATRFPINKSEVLKLPVTNPMSRQSVIIAEVETCAGPVTIVAAHLSPKGEKVREKQMKVIDMALVARWPNHPVIIAGDLNDEFDTAMFDVFKNKNFVDVMNGEGNTFDPSNPYNKEKKGYHLDYILFQKSELKMTEPARIFFREFPVSDHWGVRATFSK